MRTHQLPPNANRVITSLRDAGYNFNTAVADIVDNSIAAGATTVYIATSFSSRDGQIDVSIADNGRGMTPDEVLNAMTYGSAEREDIHSLGKFGLGLKTASTSQCRKVSLISRTSGNDSGFKLVLDIDYAQQTNRWEYIEEKVTPIDNLILDKAAKGHSGTLVRWGKCDRVLPHKYKQPGGSTHRKAFDNKIEKLIFHLGIVFQRFLDASDTRAPNVQIVLNGKQVPFWDPFCTRMAKTDCVYDDEIGGFWQGRNKRCFSIRAFVVPPRDVLSENDAAIVFPKSESPDSLQGIYVYRENRLIHWGDWCGMYRNEFHYRLARIEFSFTSDLDDLFNVDFKKSKIDIDEALKDYLKEEVLAKTRDSANARYRSNSDYKLKQEAGAVHAKANNDIGKSAPKPNYSLEKTGSGKARITNKRGKVFIEEKPVIQTDTGDGVFTVDRLPDGILWRPRVKQNSSSVVTTSVEVNRSHPFYQKAFTLCKNNPNAIKALDYLLWSLANAELATMDEDTRENYEDMRIEVSRSLRELAEKLPDAR